MDRVVQGAASGKVDISKVFSDLVTNTVDPMDLNRTVVLRLSLVKRFLDPCET